MTQAFHPHGYQSRGLRFGLENSCVGYFWDPGLGKTVEMYAVHGVLKRQKMAKRMLVIAEKNVCYEVWDKEKEEWEEFKDLRVEVLHGPHKDEALLREHDIACVNPEGLEWLLGYRNEKGTLLHGAAQRAGVWWDILCVDESTLFKHMQTERFKTLKPHLDKFRRRYILTGDPAPNGLLDLYGQMYILDGGAALGGTFTKFRSTYFFPGPNSFNGRGDWLPKPGAEKKIYKKLAPYVMRLDAKDYLNLPPYVANTVKVTLPAEVRRTYTQMEVDLLAMVDQKLVTAANVAVATQKCRQLANGGVFQDDGTISFVHDAKTDAARSIVEELSGKPCLIAYEFRHDLARLKKAFPDAPALNGDTKPKEFAEIVKRWNAGLIPVLLAQPQTTKHGLNLQKSGCVAIIWYGLTWNLDHYKQLIKRVWRQGYKKRLVVHHLIARDTIDEVMMSTLKRKHNTQQRLLDALRKYTKDRLAL